jgi:hypothetical protein
MGNLGNHFNYENMASGYQSNQDYADAFVKAAAELDKVITEEVNLPTGAIFSGNRGKKMWDNWNASASKYKDLYNILTDTNTQVRITHNDYADTENQIAGGTLTQVQDSDVTIDEEALAASAQTLADLRQAAMLRSGITNADGVPVIDIVPGGNNEVTIGDRIYKVFFDDQGRITYVSSTDLNGGNWQYEAGFSNRTMEETLTEVFNNPLNYGPEDFSSILESYGTEGQTFWSMLCSGGQFASRDARNAMMSPLSDLGIEIPSNINVNSGERYSNREYAEAGKQILESSRTLMNNLQSDTEAANKIVEYINNTIYESDSFRNLPADAQQALRDDVAALQQYNEVYQSLEHENSWSIIRNDGAFGDWDSIFVDGWRGDYAAAYQNSVDAANAINNQLAGMMTIEEFTAKYGDSFGEEFETILMSGGGVLV